jgi:hypothetical protein
LQTGLDVVATMVWWDWQTPEMLEAQDQDANSQTGDTTNSLTTFLIPLFLLIVYAWVLLAVGFFVLTAWNQFEL